MVSKVFSFKKFSNFYNTVIPIPTYVKSAINELYSGFTIRNSSHQKTKFTQKTNVKTI